MPNNTIYSVSDINAQMKKLIDSVPAFGDIFIRGELSNYKVYPSGHHYFTLKDEGGVLKAVMFRNESSKLAFRPESGMKVIIRGRITVYPRDGVYQLYANEMIADGVGALYIAYEQLKEKLQKLGMFDSSTKRPLPRYPGTICLITSSAGAAVRDMLRILKKRFPLSAVNLLPVRVQGEEAPLEIAVAIAYANEHSLGDLIITGRGGGSIEDLWAFNDERVANAIYNSQIPVISAVGHEPDYTIADFVADVRAATPSNAAEIAVPDSDELRIRIKSIEAHINSVMDRIIRLSRKNLTTIHEKRVLQSPLNYIQDRRIYLDMVHSSFDATSQRFLSAHKDRFGRLAVALDAMSPLKVLGRGYSLVTDSDGKAVSSYENVVPGDEVLVLLGSGSLNCSVTGVSENY